MSKNPFAPRAGGTKSIDVSAASQRVAVGSVGQVRVFNEGTATAYIEFGGSAVTAAAATGLPIGPGVTEVLTVDATHVAAIADGATGKIYFTPGVGI